MVDAKQQWKAWLYLSPALILLAIFTVWPIFNTVTIAFRNGYSNSGAMMGKPYPFGFKNFWNYDDSYYEITGKLIGTGVLNYKLFKNCLFNTLILCGITVPVSTFLALVIAACLNSIKPLNRFFQTIYFLPYVTNSIAIGMVFFTMFNVIGYNAAKPISEATSIGMMNSIIQFFGGKPALWISTGSDKFHNMLVLIIYIVWNALPFKILILLGGLQSVNKQYYDAAKVDGTSRIRTFFRITVPMLSPMIAYVVITGFIGGFKEYSSVVGIFGESMRAPGAGEEQTLNTMVGFIYECIKHDDMGRASAGALVLFCIILVVTLINLYVSKKKVHY